MRVRLMLLAVLALCSLNVFAIENDTVPVDKNVTIGRLENGLTYYIRQNNWPEQRVCFYLAQRVGSIQEEDSQRGLAHFLEHMCFNGSEHFKGNGIDAFCESLGLDSGDDFNAYTGIEETVYYIDNVPTTVGQEKLDSCLLVLHDWANGLLLDSVEIEKERGVIHEEWRMGRDASERILERQLPVLYPDSKYGSRMPIGTMDVVDNFTHQELRDYYEKWYNPENQCIVIVGDVDVEYMEHKIKELFSDIAPTGTAGIVKTEEVPDHKGIIFSIDKDEEMQDNWVQVFFKHKPITREDRKSLKLWKELFKTSAVVSMLNARLEDAALKAGCPFTYAECSDDDYIYASTKGAFELSATTEDGNQTKALSEMLAICHQAAEYGFTEAEYNRYVSMKKASYDNMLMKADQQLCSELAVKYYRHYLHGNNIASVEDYVSCWKDVIGNTTLDDVNCMMKELVSEREDNIVICNWNIDREGGAYPTEKELHDAYLLGWEQPVNYQSDSDDEEESSVGHLGRV